MFQNVFKPKGTRYFCDFVTWEKIALFSEKIPSVVQGVFKIPKTEDRGKGWTKDGLRCDQVGGQEGHASGTKTTLHRCLSR